MRFRRSVSSRKGAGSTRLRLLRTPTAPAAAVMAAYMSRRRASDGRRLCTALSGSVSTGVAGSARAVRKPTAGSGYSGRVPGGRAAGSASGATGTAVAATRPASATPPGAAPNSVFSAATRRMPTAVHAAGRSAAPSKPPGAAAAANAAPSAAVRPYSSARAAGGRVSAYGTVRLPTRVPSTAGRGNTTSSRPKSASTRSDATGRTPLSICSTSAPMRSRLTLCARPAWMVASRDAACRSGTMAKPKREAKRTARSRRSGSSTNVMEGASGVRSRPALRSAYPRPVQSSTVSVVTL